MTDSQTGDYPASVQAVLSILKQSGTPFEVRSFSEPARQASQAAALVGCPLGAIVKSLVFRKHFSGDLFLALVSGQNRADTHILSQLAGDAVQPAPAEVVLAETGYPVGAVPPIGMPGEYPVVMDADLMQYPQVWASAGAEHILMALMPADLQALTQAQVERIKVKRG